MANTVTPKKLAERLLNIITHDADRIEAIDNYHQGIHRLPYMPKTADAEYKMLANRAVTNMMPLVTGTCTQALYVDAFRPGVQDGGRQAASTHSPQWEFWQRSRLDARQSAVYRDGLAFGQVFIAVGGTKGDANARALSPIRTAALFRDPANDAEPYAVLSIDFEPDTYDGTPIPGEATMWDGEKRYEVTYGHGDGVKIVGTEKHGADRCPVVRFAPYVDLEGRTSGLVEPLIPLNDRINQTIFDLLVAQTYSSFRVRFATGMAPPMETEVVTNQNGEIEIKIKTDSETGQPIPKKVDHNASRFLFAEDADVKFGSLDGTPLDGFISSVDMSVRHLSAIAQIPPHHLLGQIANLSAEALQAAETSLSRKIEEFRKSFGEAWEQVFRIAAQIEGFDGADDYHAEVVWRDVSASSLSQVGDGLGKFAEALEVPRRGLWSRVPGVTQGELDEWNDLYEEDQQRRDAEARMVNSLQPSGSSQRPPRRSQTRTTEGQ